MIIYFFIFVFMCGRDAFLCPIRIGFLLQKPAHHFVDLPLSLSAGLTLPWDNWGKKE